MQNIKLFATKFASVFLLLFAFNNLSGQNMQIEQLTTPLNNTYRGSEIEYQVIPINGTTFNSGDIFSWTLQGGGQIISVNPSNTRKVKIKWDACAGSAISQNDIYVICTNRPSLTADYFEVNVNGINTNKQAITKYGEIIEYTLDHIPLLNHPVANASCDGLDVRWNVQGGEIVGDAYGQTVKIKWLLDAEPILVASVQDGFWSQNPQDPHPFHDCGDIQTVQFKPTVNLIYSTSQDDNVRVDCQTRPDDLASDAYTPTCPILSYQWESASTTSSFSPISGATGSTYHFIQTLKQTTFFRRKIVLSNGDISYSNSIKILLVGNPQENINYVKEHSILVPGIKDFCQVQDLPIGEKFQTTTYLDGLGRTIEKINREVATPVTGSAWGDIVSFSKYDANGQQTKKYLSYTTTNQIGLYKNTPEVEQANYYSINYSEGYAYSQIAYENSPLNRLQNIKLPGNSWGATSTNGNSTNYELNEATDNVKILAFDYASGLPYLVGDYTVNSLYKQITKDENNKQVIEFYNKTGQLILKKVELGIQYGKSTIEWICTYNVYDDYGLLHYQIQPEAVNWYEANTWSFTTTDGLKALNDLCFKYDYDDKGRTILKKNPGAKPLYMLYDNRDRAVFTQDGNQRVKYAGTGYEEWTANIYDELDRIVITTLYKSNVNPPVVVNNGTISTVTTTVNHPGAGIIDLILDNRTTQPPTAAAPVDHYIAQNSIELVTDAGGSYESNAGDEFEIAIDGGATLPSYTISTSTNTYNNPISNLGSANCTILKYFYYDDYTYAGAKSFDNSFNNTSSSSQVFNNTYFPSAIAADKRTRNGMTGTKVRVLGTNDFLDNTYYYDKEGKQIQTISDNIKQGQDVITVEYNWNGKVLSTHTKHFALNTDLSQTIHFGVLTKNYYDKVGRVLHIGKLFENGSNQEVNIVSYAYDDMGNLKKKTLAPSYYNTTRQENGLETQEFSYNIHNKLIGINKDYALKTGTFDKWKNYFGLSLGYDKTEGVFDASNLTGLLTGVAWTSQGDDEQRKYDYQYDDAGRLTRATFKEFDKTLATPSYSNTKMDFSVSGRNGRIQYDLNGNILYMLQRGVIAGTGTVNIDDLEYSYQTLSNKLTKVTDASDAGSANGTQGDFKDGTNANDDYVYDDNGNLIIDLNKKMDTQVNGGNVKYNYLDKPEEITITGKGVVKIVYNADGVKLQKIFTKATTGSIPVTTSYINGYVYTNNELDFINFEEGRIRVIKPVPNVGTTYLGIATSNTTISGDLSMPNAKHGVFDYFIKDHLSNTRLVLTQETHTSGATCTMEDALSTTENLIFGQVQVNTNGNVIPGPDNELVKTRILTTSIPGNGWVNSEIKASVSKLMKGSSTTVGPNSLLKVMAGDEISAKTLYFYNTAPGNTVNDPAVNNVISSLTQALSGSNVVNGTIKGAASVITAPLSNNNDFLNVVQHNVSDLSGTRPKAYLSILFFDERFNFVSENSQAIRVHDNVSDQNNEFISLTEIQVPKNGYAYIYVSNASPQPVYFDNFSVQHTRGRITEENHYYAFGLKIAALSSKKAADFNEGRLDNNYLYQGDYADFDEDLGWNDFELRNYDPQIGRWIQQDPKNEFASPYVGMGNDPVNNIDPDGGGIFDWLGNLFGGGNSPYDCPTNVNGTPSSNSAYSGLNLFGDIFAVGNAFYTIANMQPYAFNEAGMVNNVSSGGDPIYEKGKRDGFANAMSLGLSDCWPTMLGGTNHESDYDDNGEKLRYLRGRLAGNASAMAVALVEIAAGGSMVNGGATLAVSGVGAFGGAAVAGTGGLAIAHGNGVAIAVTLNSALITTKILILKTSFPADAKEQPELPEPNKTGLKYSPTKKHQKGGWGTEMDLCDEAAQEALNNSIPGGKQRYAYRNGKMYEFQPDNVGGWHGYPIKGNEAPTYVLRALKELGYFTQKIYEQLLKGK